MHSLAWGLLLEVWVVKVCSLVEVGAAFCWRCDAFDRVSIPGADRQAGVGGCRLASFLSACHTCKFAVGGIFHTQPTQFTTQVNKERYVGWGFVCFVSLITRLTANKMSSHVSMSAYRQKGDCVHAELEIDHGCRVPGYGWVRSITSSPHCLSIGHVPPSAHKSVLEIWIKIE